MTFQLTRKRLEDNHFTVIGIDLEKHKISFQILKNCEVSVVSLCL